jgi:hypothetical protein
MEMFVFRVWLPPWQQQTYNQKEFNVLSGFHLKYSNFERNF